jgi:hypothetical protein
MRRTSSTPTKRDAAPILDRSTLRTRIIQEHHLQQSVAQEDALRSTRPDLWRRLDAGRVARNLALAELNRKLRSAGCRPVALEPSLGQKMKKLRRIQALNLAETAIATKRR